MTAIILFIKVSNRISYGITTLTNNKYPAPTRSTSMAASVTASLALHGRIFVLLAAAPFSGYPRPALPPRRDWIIATASKKLVRNASRKRKMKAKAIMKIQVPAYCPVDWGVHAMEKRGVLDEVKKVMAIESMPIIVDELLEDDIDDDVDMDMSDMVLVAAAAIVVAMLSIDMPSIFTLYVVD